MAQRDYEEQPEAPDLGASVQLESAATLEAPAGDRDGLDAGYVPPDRPYGLDDDAVTGAGMREGDSLDERLRREQPEEWMSEDLHAGPSSGADADRSGRITIAGEGAALETRDAMEGVDEGIDGGAASAEEAAVHVVDAGLDADDADDADPSLDADGPAASAALAEDPYADPAAEDAAADAREMGAGQDPEAALGRNAADARADGGR
jgi:hypothetical protein